MALRQDIESNPGFVSECLEYVDRLDTLGFTLRAMTKAMLPLLHGHNVQELYGAVEPMLDHLPSRESEELEDFQEHVYISLAAHLSQKIYNHVLKTHGLPPSEIDQFNGFSDNTTIAEMRAMFRPSEE
jgi:hypothetical protein